MRNVFEVAPRPDDMLDIDYLSDTVSVALLSSIGESRVKAGKDVGEAHALYVPLSTASTPILSFEVSFLSAC